MLGIAKGAGGYRNPPTPTNVSASISPVDFVSFSSNGSYTTPFFTVTVNNGVGPFTYAWTFDAGSINAPTDKKTRLALSGYNEQVSGTVRVTVTDTGDSNKTASASSSVFVSFEDTLR